MKTLDAEGRYPASVVNRLRGRGLPGLKHEGFALAQIDRCLEALTAPKFDARVRTDERILGQVADTIAELAGLPMRADTDGPSRARLRKTVTSLRHVRHD